MVEKIIDIVVQFVGTILSLMKKKKKLKNMNEKFDRLIEFVFQHEGYKSNDIGDPGKLTIWGIASLWYPKEVEQMNKLSPEDSKKIAKNIYYKNYWLPLNCEKYPDKIALAILDSGVNCGIDTVKKWIEELKGNITTEGILFKRFRKYANLCQKNNVFNKFLLNWLIRVLHIWERNI